MKWISVQDRLPDNAGQDVLVWGIHPPSGNYCIFVGYRKADGQWNDSAGHRIGDVTHWMPLPAPPEREPK